MDIANIGENIRKIRKSKKMTLQELGDKIGLKSSAVSKYEGGAISPTVEMLKKIAAALEVDIFEILIGVSLDSMQNKIMRNVTNLINDYLETETDCNIRFRKIVCRIGETPENIFTYAQIK